MSMPKSKSHGAEAHTIINFLIIYTLDKMKIYFRKLYYRYNDLLPLRPSPLLVSVIYKCTRLTPPQITGYTLGYTAGAWPIR